MSVKLFRENKFLGKDSIFQLIEIRLAAPVFTELSGVGSLKVDDWQGEQHYLQHP